MDGRRNDRLGGFGSGVFLNTGSRYDPAADSWTATTITNAPAIRGYHPAVWTGSEMIVFGGYNGTAALNTGSRYDPAADAWTATNPTGAPPPAPTTRPCGPAPR